MTNPGQVLLADTVTKLDASHAGCVLVGASHGAVYAGYLAARAGVRAVILNDAGLGLDAAGISSLDYLDGIGIAAATVAHDTGCIANARDMMANGCISHVNPIAARLGCAAGQTTRACAERMRTAQPSTCPLAPYQEARVELLPPLDAAPAVIGCDSASLLLGEDEGRIVVTGSHGGLLGGKPDNGIAPAVRMVSFNDAGVGRNRAGIARLPDLDRRSIAAVTVAAASARIGDAASSYGTGVISFANTAAAAAGAVPGMALQAFVDILRQP